MTITQFVVGYICGAVLISIFIWIAVGLHMAYTKMDIMLSHLKKSSVIADLTPLRKNGPLGKLLLVGSISGVLTFPAMYIRRGTVNADDIKNFPRILKRKLIIMQWMGITLMSALAISVAAYELIKTTTQI